MLDSRRDVQRVVERQSRLLFKGGTSLSKSFGLIDRFSEDVDITVFRDDLGEPATFLELERLSGKKRQRRLDAIKASCQAYITGDFLRQLEAVLSNTIEKAAIMLDSSIIVDDVDPDRQTLLFWYPSALAETRDYIQSAVRIEAGAKSALDPHQTTTVLPYVAADVARLNLRVGNITTVNPERTLWDKIVISIAHTTRACSSTVPTWICNTHSPEHSRSCLRRG